MQLKLLAAVAVAALMTAGACAKETKPVSIGYGPDPQLPEPEKSLIPVVDVADAEPWKDGQKPTPAEGLAVTEFAAELNHPRSILVLPNGDVLVAETNAPPRPKDDRGVKGFFINLFQKKAGAGVPSANRITLLRDSDRDGEAETRSVLVDELFSPYGMALVGDVLYIANADGVVSVPYETGDVEIDAAPREVFPLPGGPINHHWTKNIVASPDGSRLYAAVGSNSNIAEKGMDVEEGRAAIWEIDLASGEGRVFASGLRNPVGMDFSDAGVLYTTVNERDELGDNLVPDYLTSVKDGAFYGWPWSYFGAHVDERVEPAQPDMAASAIAPDYGLGAHTASLGLEVVSGDETSIGPEYASGAFIGQHGSWNRKPPSGYKVIFVPFEGGKPSGMPGDVLTGFRTGDIAHGRPVEVALDGRGGLLVADDVGNRIWRVTASASDQAARTTDAEEAPD